jgi:hypothetical protein
MGNILISMIHTLSFGFRTRASLLAEILALRHQLAILKRSAKKRCRLGLNKDSPEPRGVQSPDKGRIVEIPKAGGLHHRYERRAA